MTFLIVLAALAVIVAAVAKHKGRDPLLWWVYGFFLFPIALVHALLMQPMPPRQGVATISPLRRCPHCAEPIQRTALLCKHCRQAVEPLPEPAPMRIFAPPAEPSPFQDVFILSDGSFAATLTNGKAIAQVDDQYYTFDSMADVRIRRKDTNEIYDEATPEQRATFLSQMLPQFRGK